MKTPLIRFDRDRLLFPFSDFDMVDEIDAADEWIGVLVKLVSEAVLIEEDAVEL